MKEVGEGQYFLESFFKEKKKILKNLHKIFIRSGVAQMVKKLPAMQETQVQSLGWEDSPGEGNGYLLGYSCLGKIPWTEEPGGLQPIGLQRVRYN